jgi:hypothetical protein
MTTEPTEDPNANPDEVDDDELTTDEPDDRLTGSVFVTVSRDEFREALDIAVGAVRDALADAGIEVEVEIDEEESDETVDAPVTATEDDGEA